METAALKTAKYQHVKRNWPYTAIFKDYKFSQERRKLQVIIPNTTEAGYSICATDTLDMQTPSSFP